MTSRISDTRVRPFPAVTKGGTVLPVTRAMAQRPVHDRTRVRGAWWRAGVHVEWSKK